MAVLAALEEVLAQRVVMVVVAVGRLPTPVLVVAAALPDTQEMVALAVRAAMVVLVVLVTEAALVVAAADKMVMDEAALEAEA
jgi:hypothetical protein